MIPSGSSGEGKTFYVVLEITNNLGGQAALLPSDNQPPQGFMVDKGVVLTVTKSMFTDLPVKFTAIDPVTKAKFFLNNQDFIQVKPTHSKDTVTKVTLTQTGNYGISRDDRARQRRSRNLESNFFQFTKRTGYCGSFCFCLISLSSLYSMNVYSIRKGDATTANIVLLVRVDPNCSGYALQNKTNPIL